MNLIIVESPTKAKTFNKFLNNKDYQVEATMGHIRDLPESKLSVDVDHDFVPSYIIPPKKKKIVSKIKSLAKKADTIILATDADREGEAISYHIACILGFVKENWPNAQIKTTEKKGLKRIVFHEITKSALEEALKNPGQLNLKLVDAQHTRRILDRIVGYKLSPLLWKKIGKRWLSAGRVQTVALRFIVEREKEIADFKLEPFFKGIGLFSDSTKRNVEAKLVSYKGVTFEKKFTLELFDGNYTYSKTTIDQAKSEMLQKEIGSDSFVVSDIVERVSKRTPPPPYITSTLQQDASHKLGFSSKNTMRLAQGLYELGLITYHRTDSVTMAEKFLNEARSYITQTFGLSYVADSVRQYSTKSKLAQEAHEAIRPTGTVSELPQDIDLTSQHLRLYELIFKRAIATQMKEAELKNVKIQILSTKEYLFESSFEKILFDGYLKLYVITAARKGEVLNKGSVMKLDDLTFIPSETNPPPRYNEASLIRILEARGIGRPSTYAPTISTIQDRQYVEKKEARFYPTILGTAVCDYLTASFKDMFEIDFTANLEDDLDDIAEGKEKVVNVLHNFYKPLSTALKIAEKKEGHINIQENTDEICPTCGKNLVIRYSKYGKFYACSGFPDCKFTKQYYEKVAVSCPKCGGEIVVRYTKRKRKFYGCSNYPKCDFAAWKLEDIKATVDPIEPSV